MTKAINEREIVLEVLLEITEQGMYSHIVLRDVLNKYQYLEKKERSFITRVTEGTLEHMMEIDYILDQFSKVKVKKMKPVIRNIMRSAVYQMKYMDSVPVSAACNEAVKLAVRKGFGSLRGFVNGVLRNVARNLDQIEYPTEPRQRLSIQYSMPEWILNLWLKAYDSDIVEQMLQAFQRETPLTIRCNLRMVTPKQLKEHLEAEGVTVKVHPYLEYAFHISGFDYLGDLESFQNGEFSVQDISSMLVSELAGPKEGDYVIDVCAAPGGKSLHMAEKLNGSGHVEARDLTEYKVGLIQENIERTGLSNVEAVQQDALIFDETSVGKADIVLADLPCSGLGVLAKKTDLKYKATKEGADSLAKLQREMLKNVQAYVKDEGKLVYSTCTINPAENMDNVHWFLNEYPEFELIDIHGLLCEELQKDVKENGCIQLLPGVHQSDGFFLACMKKRK
ncbi:16S rRNA (cytosine(967)-C(5))-methyltransferase RsmB [Mediterraneibacter sp. NSJ-151]|uniref:16S rRNA (cytosine(967)-C(5))-methyltransferase RsmB n=1 Tax=Mediterraneibacter sp. NSJ-151 TaxID=2897708 RepID=UPI001F0A96D4|nr:16S rRNA (cytosine(967)-C(5))-methyltransferase RsmB [Mediterraneibacter sp. NSJ-151]MCH4281422.1 16S rRNA (cytosine(967)-C(5))-methyltransferase RsmB [Mediterraneibacter sp. NSJ-151]